MERITGGKHIVLKDISMKRRGIVMDLGGVKNAAAQQTVAGEKERDMYRVDRDREPEALENLRNDSPIFLFAKENGGSQLYTLTPEGKVIPYGESKLGCLEPDKGPVFPQPSNRYLRFDLIPIDVLTEVVEVFTFGEWKHVEQAKGEGKSWKSGIEYSHRVNKILRHLFDFVRGRNYDEESGRHPLAHVIVQAMMLLGMCMRQGYTKFDDRSKFTGDNSPKVLEESPKD